VSSNKFNNTLDFRNVKQTQFDQGQVLKGSFSELQSGLRTYTTTPVLKDAYTHFFQQTNSSGYPTYVEYWQASAPSMDRLQFRADNSGDLSGKYFTMEAYLEQKTFTFYYVVDSVGTAPGIGDVEVPINLSINDPSSVVAFETKKVIENIKEFIVTKSSYLSSFIEIEYLQFGNTSTIDTGNTGFLTSRLKEGQSFKVGEINLDYDINNNPIYNGNTLRGLLFNPYTASFDVERDEITVTAQVDLAPLISTDPEVFNIPMADANQEYSQELPLDTKRFQIGIRDSLSSYRVSYISNGPVFTYNRGVVYEEQGLKLEEGNRTIYFQSPKPDMVMEIIIWK